MMLNYSLTLYLTKKHIVFYFSFKKTCYYRTVLPTGLSFNYNQFYNIINIYHEKSAICDWFNFVEFWNI